MLFCLSLSLRECCLRVNLLWVTVCLCWCLCVSVYLCWSLLSPKWQCENLFLLSHCGVEKKKQKKKNRNKKQKQKSRIQKTIDGLLSKLKPKLKLWPKFLSKTDKAPAPAWLQTQKVSNHNKFTIIKPDGFFSLTEHKWIKNLSFNLNLNIDARYLKS